MLVVEDTVVEDVGKVVVEISPLILRVNTPPETDKLLLVIMVVVAMDPPMSEVRMLFEFDKELVVVMFVM
ncbi:hypothetical protein SDC9_184961 [bioreactor metagenome]|uniref:Uncharacterized protein n=1 Tax=bioreactor metagenome TaxID=1076179 RepID=A0A645HPZ4_9ZZZZ